MTPINLFQKKWIYPLASCTLALGMLAGCGDSGDEEGADNSGGSENSGGSSSGGSGQPDGGSSSGGSSSGGSENSGGSSSGGGTSDGGRTSDGGSSSGGASSGGGPSSGGSNFGPPNLDEEGWFDVDNPPEGIKEIFVSSSTGDDNNPGTKEQPVATLAKGIDLMGAGDWLRLKTGDTFNEQIAMWVNGPDPEQPTVFTYYSEDPENPGPRPIIDPGGRGGAMFQGGGGRPYELVNVALVGLHFQQSENITDDPNHTPSSAVGVTILHPAQNVLLEDLMIDHFAVNINAQGSAEGGIYNLVLRRSVLVDAYAIDEVGHSQAIYMDYNHDAVLEENVFDHNGFHDVVQGAEKTQFNHNVYCQRTSTNPLLQNNLIMRGSSHGFQLRQAGRALGNILVENAIAGFVGTGNLQPNAGIAMSKNVVLHGSIDNLAGAPRGWGLELLWDPDYDTPTITLDMTGNIIAHAESPAQSAWKYARELSDADVDETETVVYKWGDSPDVGGPFPDGERTIQTYMESIGQEDTSLDAFYAEARKLRRGYMNPDFTAQAIRAYFAEGFGVEE